MRLTIHVLRSAFVAALAVAAGCSASVAPAVPTPSPQTGSGTLPPGPPPLVQNIWAARSREHVDLWLHSYAMLTSDTTLVPYFHRGYLERMNALRHQRGVSTLLDANRGRLLAGIVGNPAATSGQFVPLYFTSQDQMRQAIDLFVRGNGRPTATMDHTARVSIAVLASAFPTAADREWLKLFAESVDDESRRFYHDYWAAEERSHAATISHVDSLWQRLWRPSLQRFLNNSEQQNGELYLSLPLGGEGRSVHFSKQENVVAGPMPDGIGDAEIVLYVMAHEITGAAATAALADNTTPAERRIGSASRYEQAAAVRAGAILLERTVPNAVPGYMRYYLQASGRVAPIDPRTAFLAAFVIPDAVRDALGRQFDLILGGI